LKLIERVTNWWDYSDPAYGESLKELKIAGMETILNFLFIGLASTGFLFYKFVLYSSVNPVDDFDIIFNISFFGYGILFLLFASFCHHFLREVKYIRVVSKGFTKLAFQFFMSFIFILFAGISTRMVPIPFFKVSDPLVFVAFVEMIFFLCLSFWIKVVLPKSSLNKSKIIKGLLLVALVSLVIAVVGTFVDIVQFFSAK